MKELIDKNEKEMCQMSGFYYGDNVLSQPIIN